MRVEKRKPRMKKGQISSDSERGFGRYRTVNKVLNTVNSSVDKAYTLKKDVEKLFVRKVCSII